MPSTATIRQLDAKIKTHKTQKNLLRQIAQNIF